MNSATKVVSGSGVLLLFRSISPAFRAQMGWKGLWVPVVGPIACVAIQTIAGACGLFPMPYLVLTAAVPAQMVALLAAGLSIPADLMTADVRRWWMYVTFGFIAYPGQSMLFMLWLAVFPKLTEVLQVLGSFALTSLLAVSAILMERIGMWLALPTYLLYEIKAWWPSGTLFPFFRARFPYKVTNPKKGYPYPSMGTGQP